MKCPKCELELVDIQKVCPRCGAYTPASGFYYTERKSFVITKQMKIAAGIAVGVLIALIIHLAFRITPPDRVALDFYEALSERRLNDARQQVTTKFMDMLADQMSDFREKSEPYYLDASSLQLEPILSKSIIDDTKVVETANVTITLLAPGQQSGRQVVVFLVKQGRKWLVDDIN